MKLILCKYAMKLLRKAEGNTAYVSWVTVNVQVGEPSGGDRVFFSIFGGKPHTTDCYHFERSIQEHQESSEYRTSPGEVSQLPQLKSHLDCGWHLLLAVQIKREWQRDDHHLASLAFLLAPQVNCSSFPPPNYQNQFPSFHCSLGLNGSPGPSIFWCQIGTAEAPCFVG